MTTKIEEGLLHICEQILRIDPEGEAFNSKARTQQKATTRIDIHEVLKVGGVRHCFIA